MTQQHKVVILEEKLGAMPCFKPVIREFISVIQEKMEVEHIFFFRDIPHWLERENQSGYCIYTNTLWTDFKFLHNILNNIDKETIIVIISDAGAVANSLHYDLIKKSYEFLSYLNRCDRKVIWFNPMPEDRRKFNSAEHIEKKVKMFEADLNGLNEAITFLDEINRNKFVKELYDKLYGTKK